MIPSGRLREVAYQGLTDTECTLVDAHFDPLLDCIVSYLDEMNANGKQLAAITGLITGMLVKMTAIDEVVPNAVVDTSSNEEPTLTKSDRQLIKWWSQTYMERVLAIAKEVIA